MVNFEHKDRLFTFMFGREENREWMLSLYNAVNGSGYTDAEAIEITTIDDAVYMGMKNDASFLLHWVMSLWAHQSTYNLNMPVRELMYLGKLYDKYIHQRKANIYGSTLIRLPVPKLVVFYNGRKDQDDEKILRLSDAFPDNVDVVPDVEVNVRMLNINRDHNQKLMRACKPLSEYAWLVQAIRDNTVDGDVESAVDKAIDEMPEDYLIRDFLVGNRAEVKDMCLTEYDEEETMQMFMEEGERKGRAEGRAEGEDKLARLMQALLSAGRTDDAQKATVDLAARTSLYEEFSIA